ncbi:endonuclease domain-containing protein [Modestobacter sp. SSW1-42]|uniref:endonuclease domain-containing protein n=1 Tax=Modestobacter sp. SSW1-42 TaxID=596372 RepID=UPI003986D949
MPSRGRQRGVLEAAVRPDPGRGRRDARRAGRCVRHLRGSSPEHLDHDHDTGRVRALLCQRCNHGLGLFRDDSAFLRAAADYVDDHREDALVAAATGPGSAAGRRVRGPARPRPESPAMARGRALFRLG